MLSKDRVFIVSSNVDDSIKSASIYSEVYVFKTFKEFEDYIDVTPIDASMIIVNSSDLPFTNNSMNRLVNVVNSTFVSLSGFLYYMVDDKDIEERVVTVIKKHNQDKIKCLYSQTLHAKDVADVLSGESLSSKETVVELRTYRIRAADYVRSQKDKEGLNYEEAYVSDEDELSNIKDEPVPEDLRATDSKLAVRHIVCGDNIREVCSWVLLKAQYLALNGKVLILEKDIEYHTLFDMISKIQIPYDFFDIVDIYRDCYGVISQIKNSKSKIIFVGSKSRIKYNYDILMNILISNLRENLDFYIYQSELSKIPYGVSCDIIIPTTVPEILKAVNTMSNISSFDDLRFIGLDITNLGIVSINESEFKTLLQDLFRENSIKSVVVKIQGLILRKEVGLGGIFMHNQYNN